MCMGSAYPQLSTRKFMRQCSRTYAEAGVAAYLYTSGMIGSRGLTLHGELKVTIVIVPLLKPLHSRPWWCE